MMPTYRPFSIYDCACARNKTLLLVRDTVFYALCYLMWLFVIGPAEVYVVILASIYIMSC